MLAVGEAGTGAEDGAERAIGAVGDADEQDAEAGDRRIAIERRQVQAHGLQRLRRSGGRKRRRQHGDAIEDAADHEEYRRAHVVERDHHLAADDADQGDADIEREDRAAAFIAWRARSASFR